MFVSGTELKRAYQTAKRAAWGSVRKSTYKPDYEPAYNDVFRVVIDVTAGTVHLTCSDLRKVACRVKVAQTNSEDFETIPLYREDLEALLKLIKTKGEKIRIVHDEGAVTFRVCSTREELTFRTCEPIPDEYLFRPNFTGNRYKSGIPELAFADTRRLQAALAGVVTACTTDETRPVLTHVYISPEQNGHIDFVATDTYRLAIATVQRHDCDNALNNGLLISRRAITGFVSIPDKATGAYTFVETDGRNVSIRTGSVTIYTPLGDGQFVNYRKITDPFPGQNLFAFRDSAETIVNAIKAAAVDAPESGRMLINVLPEKQAWTIQAHSTTNTAGSELVFHDDLPAETHRETIPIKPLPNCMPWVRGWYHCFNHKFLITAINAVGDNVAIGSAMEPDGEVYPLKPIDVIGDNCRHILMPMGPDDEGRWGYHHPKWCDPVPVPDLH